MTVELAIKAPTADHVVKDIVRDALMNEAKLARFRYEQFQRECATFEQQFNMPSDEFLQRFDAGEMGDDEVYFDWFAAVRGRNVWQQKAQVLATDSLAIINP